MYKANTLKGGVRKRNQAPYKVRKLPRELPDNDENSFVRHTHATPLKGTASDEDNQEPFRPLNGLTLRVAKVSGDGPGLKEKGESHTESLRNRQFCIRAVFSGSILRKNEKYRGIICLPQRKFALMVGNAYIIG